MTPNPLDEASQGGNAAAGPGSVQFKLPMPEAIVHVRLGTGCSRLELWRQPSNFRSAGCVGGS
eukprot:6587662-Alexandrium_andersonii.AAC.1